MNNINQQSVLTASESLHSLLVNLLAGFPTPKYSQGKANSCKFTYKGKEIEYVAAGRERQREQCLEIKGRL
jgi:hypothetical protein